MKSVRLNVILLGLATAMTLVACDRGEKRDSTANNALLKMQCVRGFDTQAFNGERAKAAGADSAIRTYVQKLQVIVSGKALEDLSGGGVTDPVDINELSGGGVVHDQQVVDPNVDIIASSDAGNMKSQNLISVNKDCANLTADVAAPGLRQDSLKGLQIVAITKNKISLAKNENGRQITIDVEDVANDSDKKADGALKKRGQTTLKLSLNASGADLNESLEVVQKSGGDMGSAIVFDPSVVKLMERRYAGKQLPDVLKNAKAALGSSDTHKLESQSTAQNSLSFSESAVWNQLAEIAAVEKAEQGLTDANAGDTQTETTATTH